MGKEYNILCLSNNLTIKIKKKKHAKAKQKVIETGKEMKKNDVRKNERNYCRTVRCKR